MECAEGWLKLRLRAMVQIFCKFVWSTTEKMCFCNTIKLTQYIFLSSMHSALLENVVIQVHKLLFSKDLNYGMGKTYLMNIDWKTLLKNNTAT